jgi:hypothetical protein
MEGGALAVAGSIVSKQQQQWQCQAFLFSVGVDTLSRKVRVHHVTVRLTYTTAKYLKCKRYVSYHKQNQSKSVSRFNRAHPSIAMIPPSGVTGPKNLALSSTINIWYRLQRGYILLLIEDEEHDAAGKDEPSQGDGRSRETVRGKLRVQ